VAAANHRGFAEGPPRQTEPWRPLLIVRIGDRVRQSGFAAGLNQALQITIRGGRSRLCSQVDILGLAGDNDRPRLRSVEGAGLSAIRGSPGRVLVSQADVERQAARDL